MDSIGRHLLDAAAEGDVEKAEKMLTAGADVNTVDKVRTRLGAFAIAPYYAIRACCAAVPHMPV